MLSGHIRGATRDLGRPSDWNEAERGPCDSLPVRDEMYAPGLPAMTSAWYPTVEELELLQSGAPIYLRILGGTHPPVSVFVGERPL